MPDTVNAMLAYREGFTVNLSSTFNNESASESGFEILGTEGSISFRGGRLVFTPENVHERQPLGGGLVAAGARRRLLRRSQGPGPGIARNVGPQGVRRRRDVGRGRAGTATIIHMGHFVDAVRSRTPPNETADRGHHAAAGAHMVNMSIREKRLVEWDFDKDTVRT